MRTPHASGHDASDPVTSEQALIREYSATASPPESNRMLRAAAFIEPCLPSPADKPPSGSNWIHEIKHDGYRLMARRDPVGIRLITRQGQ